MFYKYLLVNEGKKEVLYLYINDKNEFNINSNDIYTKVYNYLKNTNILFNGCKVYFVYNGIIMSSIDLSDYDFRNGSIIETIGENSSDKFIDLNKSNGIVEQVKLNEYILGVVSGEMPAVFHEEALKAQAIIARTYAMKRLSRNLPIYNLNSTQIYRDKDYLKSLWQNKYDEYSKRIMKIVNETKNEVILFDGDYIDAYYHLYSNGQTEDSSNVLKLAYPYLVSVPSEWDSKKDTVSRRIVPIDYLSKLLNMKISKNTPVEIIMKTIGHRVKYIKFGNKVFDGLILAGRLGLDSNDFTVSIENDYVAFTTKGHGHGLGLSKYGAEAMAKAGYNYKQIIQHYYPNTYIQKVIV